jgi:hypothetical protein
VIRQPHIDEILRAAVLAVVVSANVAGSMLALGGGPDDRYRPAVSTTLQSFARAMGAHPG